MLRSKAQSLASAMSIRVIRRQFRAFKATSALATEPDIKADMRDVGFSNRPVGVKRKVARKSFSMAMAFDCSTLPE